MLNDKKTIIIRLFLNSSVHSIIPSVVLTVCTIENSKELWNGLYTITLIDKSDDMRWSQNLTLQYIMILILILSDAAYSFEIRKSEKIC